MWRALSCATVTAFAALLFSTAPASASDKYANIHTVGVASFIGDDLVLYRIGEYGFHADIDVLSTKEWHIDDQVVAWIREALSDRFAIKPVTVDKSLFSMCAGNDVARCNPVLPTSPDVDAILVVFRSARGNPYATRMPIIGLGVMHNDMIFGPEPNELFAIFGAAIFDARTGKRIDYGTASMATDLWSAGAIPGLRLDERNWVSADSLSREQLIMMRDYMFRTLAISLPGALSNMDLVPKPASVGGAERRRMILGELPISYFHDQSWSSAPFVMPEKIDHSTH